MDCEMFVLLLLSLWDLSPPSSCLECEPSQVMLGLSALSLHQL